jgi:peptidoglycan/LPS O-acetylase OafA/YrhL
MRSPNLARTTRPVQPKHSAGRIDDVEALRVIAIAFTLLQHLEYLFPWGNDLLIRKDNYVALYTGVDLFFAISGFVIERDLLGRLDSAEPSEAKFRSVVAFWIRRVDRI